MHIVHFESPSLCHSSDSLHVISVLLSRNRRRMFETFDGAVEWRITSNFERRIVFPIEIALIDQRPDIIIWSVN